MPKTETENPIVRFRFKDEDEVGGESVGPVVAVTQRDDDHVRANPNALGVPYDPDRIQRWVTLSEARALAAEHGVPLEES